MKAGRPPAWNDFRMYDGSRWEKSCSQLSHEDTQIDPRCGLDTVFCTRPFGHEGQHATHAEVRTPCDMNDNFETTLFLVAIWGDNPFAVAGRELAAIVEELA